jgi:3',5'-cyclic-AMP phosphodiesterase
MKRRDFIVNSLGTIIALQISPAAFSAMAKVKKEIKIGLITDLHHDVIHDAPERLGAFLKKMKKVKPDAIMQMGDFAYPGEKNKEVIDMFNNAHPNRFHVIGNHDTDLGFKKEQCISYWGMPDRYYSKEINGITFVVLDGNDNGSPTYKGGYAAFINAEQMGWLRNQLRQLEGPIVIVSHQPLAGAMAVDNAEEIQDILSTAADKILLAVNGHTHVDSLLQIKNITYLTINSASYFWVGSNYKHESYPPEVHQSHHSLSSTCPYKEPLFTVMTIDPRAGLITVEGKKSEWVGKSPGDLGFNEKIPLKFGQEIVPFIRERKIRATGHQNR